ncbi:MAG: GTP pyrophosphokinase [Betaproteobacteria bacterium]|nr:GTP pyrophosphokinase [Betaproteobacteria bacterium]
MSTLEKAIAIAAEAHAGAVDKAGAPYILHPLRVMLGVSTTAERIVAILHDVVEDSAWTFEALRAEGFSEEVIAGLESVTKRSEDEPYDDFVARAAANPIGRQVKLSDLKDNLDLSRIPQPTDRDLARIQKYKRAVAFLNACETFAKNESAEGKR